MNDVTAERDRLVKDLNEVVADTRRLLESMASAGDERAGEMGAEARRKIALARLRAREVRDTLGRRGAEFRRRASAAASTADRTVHDHAWTAVAIAAAVGFAAGMMLDRSIHNGERTC